MKTPLFLINEIKYINIENDKVILKSQNQTFEKLLFNVDEVNIIGKISGILIKN
jgi:SOS-response transcriptional repressor LexA